MYTGTVYSFLCEMSFVCNNYGKVEKCNVSRLYVRILILLETVFVIVERLQCLPKFSSFQVDCHDYENLYFPFFLMEPSHFYPY